MAVSVFLSVCPSVPSVIAHIVLKSFSLSQTDGAYIIRLVITCIFVNLHRNLLIITTTPRRLINSMFFISCPAFVTAICSSLLRMMSMLMVAGLMLSGIHLYTPAVSSPTYDIIIIIILFSVFCIVFIIYILYSVFAHLQYTYELANCT